MAAGFPGALERARADPDGAAALAALARAAIEAGEEDAALPMLAGGAERAGSDARLWQWTALLYRALHRHGEALPAFALAAALAPGDGSIAFGHAYATLEAGLDAVEQFETAQRLDPANGEVLLGLAAARYAVGDGARGLAELDAVLAQHPGWIAGHSGYAQLSCLLGAADTATATLERALVSHSGDAGLWRALVETLSQGNRFDAMRDAIARGRAASGDSAFFDVSEAEALSQTGDGAGADTLFAKVAHIDELAVALRRVRHLLRMQRVAEALPLIDRWIGDPGATPLWPLASVAWRVAGNPRWEWLEGDPRLISVIDLADRLPLDRLAAALRAMHPAQGQPFAQSVRGGTQTDGVLFTRIDPEIVALRAAIVDAVTGHIAQLPPPDPAHPTLGLRRDRPVRFSGAWSVRLSGGGHHASHVHPLGWFSSALYVALPPARAGEGTLVLGEPPEDLGIDLPPLRRIEARPGQLVLFPSTMWHRTTPFAEGERLTVAFDVAPPR